MPFVFLNSARPAFGHPQFTLSHPSNNREEIERCATESAVREHGVMDPESFTISASLEDIQDKIQIVELHVPETQFEEWHSGHGTYMYKETVDQFHQMNRRAGIAKDEARIKTKATLVAQGLTSPDSILNTLPPDVGGAISAFSTKAAILSGPKLEEIAMSHIEKHIAKKTTLVQTDLSA